MDLKQIRTGTTAANAPRPMLAEITLVMVQPVIDGVIAAAATEHMRQETTPVFVPVRRNADTENLKRRLDRIMGAHIV